MDKLAEWIVDTSEFTIAIDHESPLKKHGSTAVALSHGTMTTTSFAAERRLGEDDRR